MTPEASLSTDSSYYSPLKEPNMQEWITEAKKEPQAPFIGMYLTHNGVVRATPKKVVRAKDGSAETQKSSEATKVTTDEKRVRAINFSYDKKGLEQAIAEARSWTGIYYVRVWLNEGLIPVGSSLMYVLIGADIRPHAIEALSRLMDHIKSDLVSEVEVYEQ